MGFFQIVIYLISVDESRQIGDVKLQSITQIVQVVSISKLLVMHGNDFFSLVVFFFALFSMLAYFIYVGVLTYVRNN